MNEFHRRIVRDTFRRRMSDEGALLLFSVLHYYQIVITGPVISDRPVLQAGTNIYAITQRSCGEAVAEIWAGTDKPQADYLYWYHLWRNWGGYEKVETLTPDERARMRWLIRELEKHPFVAWLIPEDDFDPAADPQ